MTLEIIRPNVKEPKRNWNTKDMFCGLTSSTDFLFRVKKTNFAVYHNLVAVRPSID